MAIWQFKVLDINKTDVSIIEVGCVDQNKLISELNLTGQNILFTNENDLRKKILENYPCIKTVKIKQKFPRDVEVIIEGRKAFARLAPHELTIKEATPSSQTAFLNWTFPALPQKQLLVDEEGVILGISQEDNLPILFWPDMGVGVGQRLDSRWFGSISLAFADLTTWGFNDLMAKVEDQDLLVGSKPRLVFSLKEEILRQLASLQLILQKAKIDGREMETIDLRFDKPVVVYSPKK